MTAPVMDPVTHFGAVRARLDALSSSITVYEDDVPDEPSFPYVVLRMSTGDEQAEMLCGVSNEADWWAWLTCVGETGMSARVVAREVRAALADSVLTVAGRVCTPLRKESSLPVQPDRDVVIPGTNLHPMFGVDGYHFTSRAA